jgi:iron complex outermembrane receptor protein
MINRTRGPLSRALLAGTSAIAIISAGPAFAQDATRSFDIPAQPLSSALLTYSRQSDTPVIASMELLKGKSAPTVRGDLPQQLALQMLLEGSGLRAVMGASGGLVVERVAADPQGGSAGAEVEGLIVTAQKREEDIQDVPIAMSAFSQETLTRSQIAGGADLMTQVPNMTFTKTNFSGYSIQIRGIGTQAISATTDPAVAVAFNNSSMIRNRFFEQEFYDLQRIEVLRGPQGTLYGRNATAGVVNILSAKPKHVFEAKASADIANYSSTRLEGMVNIPLVEDKLAMRLAGAWTKREGFVTNEVSGQQIDGRDLWSTRLSLAFEPTDRVSAFFVWEHFEEDDDRLRSGKQLCKKDEFESDIGGVPVPLPNQGGSGSEGGGSNALNVLTYLSQGCEAASLYSEESFQTPNGYALPYYGPLATLGFPTNPGVDVYLSSTQSRDLRVIESSYDPSYKASSDVAQLQFNIDLTDNLSLVSETLYSTDELFSTQDFNRFSTRPGAFKLDSNGGQSMLASGLLDENGVFCDPQLGCSDRLTLGDLSTHRSSQFSQELRLSSDFDGPFNFSLGGNFLRYDTVDKYYVFINSLSLWSAWQWNGRTAANPYVPGVSDNTDCLSTMLPGDVTRVFNIVNCIYIDPNPIGSLNDKGHNYFLSKNPYRLISYALFGEAYYNITPELKLTAGLRYTIDKKHAPRVPSWLLASHTVGHPTAEIIDREWREPTGRLALDWQPELGFTDETLLYASYAHGYKAGGTNPPSIAFSTFNGSGDSPELVEEFLGFPETFEPEFVDAYELGTKNTLLDGKVTLNGNVFYYDYKGYQISQIVNRSALNLNFDAKIWGAELEADWRPLDNLKFGLKLGFEKTKVGDGQSAIDLIDRTAGDPNYIVIRPLPTIPSNCILPVSWVQQNGLGGATGLGLTTCTALYYLEGDVMPDDGLDPSTVPNNGAGINKDLSGNELPNAPDMTATFTFDYTLPLRNDWMLTFHGDAYRQSEAWTRIFNFDPYDRLEPFEQLNLAAIFVNEDAGWNIMAYVKNVFDADNITGAFLNSDDTGLTTNVFLNEPRLYGLRVTKRWSGEPWWTPGTGNEGPFPLTVELGGTAARLDAPGEVFRPAWVDAFTSSALPFPIQTQEEDLDWGDSREAKVTYRRGAWTASGAARFGRTNGAAESFLQQDIQGGYYYNDPEVGGLYSAYTDVPPDLRVGDARNAAQSSTHDREEHTLIDFAVGRDAGLGLLGAGSSSTVSLGVRYGEFRSSSSTFMEGIPDYYMPAYGAKYIASTLHHYNGRFSRESEFRGAGPTLSWEASKQLFRPGGMGHVNVDWSVTGGALLGEQKASTEGSVLAEYFVVNGLVRQAPDFGVPMTSTTTLLTPRSERKDITVPFGGASLGLSYEIDRFKISGGYRWERYVDVLDGGVEERLEVDRTIDGPYFKLTVGFGG